MPVSIAVCMCGCFSPREGDVPTSCIAIVRQKLSAVHTRTKGGGHEIGLSFAELCPRWITVYVFFLGSLSSHLFCLSPPCASHLSSTSSLLCLTHAAPFPLGLVPA